MQIYGDNYNAWLNYFVNKYNFTKMTTQWESPSHTILYMEDEKQFIFDTSLMEISLEGFR